MINFHEVSEQFENISIHLGPLYLLRIIVTSLPKKTMTYWSIPVDLLNKYNSETLVKTIKNVVASNEEKECLCCGDCLKCTCYNCKNFISKKYQNFFVDHDIEKAIFGIGTSKSSVW